jgi:hypothetical protein
MAGPADGKFLSLQQKPVITALPSEVLTATDCPPTAGRQDHINAVGDMGVTVDFDHVNLIEDIRIIAVINRMRVF